VGQSDGQLSQVTFTDGRVGAFLGPAQRREQHCRQNHDYGYYHQKFDECEGVSVSVGLSVRARVVSPGENRVLITPELGRNVGEGELFDWLAHIETVSDGAKCVQ
jgi:hypothetical protein